MIIVKGCSIKKPSFFAVVVVLVEILTEPQQPASDEQPGII